MLDGVPCNVCVAVAVGHAALIALLLDPGCGASSSFSTHDNTGFGAANLFWIWHSRFGSWMGGVLGFVPRLIFVESSCLTGLLTATGSLAYSTTQCVEVALSQPTFNGAGPVGVVDLGGFTAFGRGGNSRGWPRRSCATFGVSWIASWAGLDKAHGVLVRASGVV